MARRFWTKDEVSYLEQAYPDTPMSELKATLKRTDKAIYGCAVIHGFARSPEFLQRSRIKKGQLLSTRTVFSKGHKPWNKGKKGWQPDSEACKTAQFKKGNLPHNTAEADGEIRKRSDGYWYIRIALAKWALLHRYQWEVHHGQVPKGMVVTFIDRNPDNCQIENLTLITRQENMARNTIHNLPEDLKSTIKLISKVKKVIKQHAT